MQKLEINKALGVALGVGFAVASAYAVVECLECTHIQDYTFCVGTCDAYGGAFKFTYNPDYWDCYTPQDPEFYMYPYDCLRWPEPTSVLHRTFTAANSAACPDCNWVEALTSPVTLTIYECHTESGRWCDPYGN